MITEKQKEKVISRIQEITRDTATKNEKHLLGLLQYNVPIEMETFDSVTPRIWKRMFDIITFYDNLPNKANRKRANIN